jgi:hypothetical protein
LLTSVISFSLAEGAIFLAMEPLNYHKNTIPVPHNLIVGFSSIESTLKPGSNSTTP